jgi:hypothetical protein
MYVCDHELANLPRVSIVGKQTNGNADLRTTTSPHWCVKKGVPYKSISKKAIAQTKISQKPPMSGDGTREGGHTDAHSDDNNNNVMMLQEHAV